MLAALLMGMSVVQAVSQPALLDAFDSHCLRGNAPLAAGFVQASDPAHRNMRAWDKGGIRLLTRAATSDAATKEPRRIGGTIVTVLSPACGVSADLGRFRGSMQLFDAVSARVGALVVPGQRSRQFENWTFLAGHAFVHLKVDRKRWSNVIVTILIDRPDGEVAE